MAIYKLGRDFIFPDPSQAEPEGLLAVGGDLSAERILIAYSMGIFPWYSDGQPILWWSPDPRLVLLPDRIHLSKSLRRVLRSDRYVVFLDRDFSAVIRHCSSVKRPFQNGTWITAEMIRAYEGLHEAGFAHSVEAYHGSDLVGGLYGLSLGGAFFGESMFSLKPDASKVALAALAHISVRQGFHFIDCQVPTDHLKRLGAIEIDRDDYIARLFNALTRPTEVGSWARFRPLVGDGWMP
jgi:leucyl/phenylalanyl-tRNA---protein transferase